MDIIFLLYEGVTALDVVGPLEVLSRLPKAKIHCVAVKRGEIHTCSGISFIADKSLEEISKADVLVIPGSKSATDLKDYPDILAWIRAIDMTTTWTTSVCTGSLILGATGLLEGRRATSHWKVVDRLSDYDAKPTHERVVEDGKVLTAAGVSAGIDMALILAAKIAGKEVAKSIQHIIEYDPYPQNDFSSLN